MVKLAKKKDALMNAFCKYVYDIEIQEPEYKSLVYEQINNSVLLEKIEKAKNALKVKSPIEGNIFDEVSSKFSPFVLTQCIEIYI